MMKTLLLICAIGTSHADCSMDTAAAVIQGPDAMSLVGMRPAWPSLHRAWRDRRVPRRRAYLKISCTSGRRLHAAAKAPTRSTAQATD